MADDFELPQIYLVTPPVIDLDTFPARLDAVLQAHDIACLRLALAGTDEDETARTADALREIAHRHDVAIVIDRHVMLAQRLGLDGVHLLDGREVRAARKTLGEDAIVGAFGGTSQHDGMLAGEAGADYITFGPAGDTALGQGDSAPQDLFDWWSKVVELPVVAEGGLTPDVIRRLTPVTDFFAIGDEIWRSDDPVAALSDLLAVMQQVGAAG
ncbi:MAG: thiamine phosphate synthase [Primorskyibacter sp.]